MDGIEFATDRLQIMALAAARTRLAEALPALLSPGVLAPLPPSLGFAPGDDPQRWISDREAESTVLVVQRRDDDAVIGLVLLGAGTAGVMHLGYLLAEPAWGQGFASELVAGLVAWCDRRGPVQLVGGVAQDNPASARVLEKAGFRAASAAGDMRIYRRPAGKAT